ncbi:hypothetical protein JCM10450v2_002562 [Rhodotorula kratochvilovae]
MDKIKQVFSHTDSNKSPSGHFSTDSEENARGAPFKHASGSTTETPSHSSAGDRAVVDGSAPSHSTAKSSAGDRLANAAVDGTHSSHEHHDRSIPRDTTSTTGISSGNTHSTGTVPRESAGSHVAEGAEHLREHAHPPAHKHHLPGRDAVLSEADAKQATHDHQHLAPVTHETRHTHEVEEIERQREIDRHVHHVQHHVQPVLDTQHAAEVQHEKAVPVTEINERHVATDEDKAQFASLNTAKDTVVEAPREKVIIDKGEQVRENVSHHVHHVVQPSIERDVHEHHRIHTVVPIHQTTHEAPVVHASVLHEPLSLKDFVAGGGDLKSTLKHDADKLLNRGECERTVDGPAETLVEQLGLASINDKTGAQTTTGPNGINTSSSSAAGTAATGAGPGAAAHNTRI